MAKIKGSLHSSRTRQRLTAAVKRARQLNNGFYNKKNHRISSLSAQDGLAW